MCSCNGMLLSNKSEQHRGSRNNIDETIRKLVKQTSYQALSLSESLFSSYLLNWPWWEMAILPVKQEEGEGVDNAERSCEGNWPGVCSSHPVPLAG